MDRARGVMETAAEKIKIVKPGDSVMVPVPDLDTVQCTVDGVRSMRTVCTPSSLRNTAMAIGHWPIQDGARYILALV